MEDSAALPRLSERERMVIDMLSRGHAFKVVAAELGLSISTVSVYAARAQAKLGAHWRFAFGRAVGTQDALLAGLSGAERMVTLAALRGLSNAEIALSRGCSPRTVANLLARAFRKLGVRGRGELCARCRASQ